MTSTFLILLRQHNIIRVSAACSSKRETMAGSCDDTFSTFASNHFGHYQVSRIRQMYCGKWFREMDRFAVSDMNSWKLDGRENTEGNLLARISFQTCRLGNTISGEDEWRKKCCLALNEIFIERLIRKKKLGNWWFVVLFQRPVAPAFPLCFEARWACTGYSVGSCWN